MSQSPRSQKIKRIIVSGFIFLGIISALYYILLVAPARELAQSISSWEIYLGNNYFALAQTQVGLDGLIRISPGQPNFNYTRERFFQLANQNFEDQDLHLPGNTLGNSLLAVYLQLATKSSITPITTIPYELFKTIKPVLDESNQIHDKASKLYLYNPIVDLGGLDIAQDRAESNSRTAAAIAGISEIKQKLGNAELDPEFEKILNQLKTLKDQTSSLGQTSFKAEVENLNTDITVLKQKVYVYEISPLKSISDFSATLDSYHNYTGVLSDFKVDFLGGLLTKLTTF